MRMAAVLVGPADTRGAEAGGPGARGTGGDEAQGERPGAGERRIVRRPSADHRGPDQPTFRGALDALPAGLGSSPPPGDPGPAGGDRPRAGPAVGGAAARTRLGAISAPGAPGAGGDEDPGARSPPGRLSRPPALRRAARDVADHRARRGRRASTTS